MIYFFSGIYCLVKVNIEIFKINKVGVIGLGNYRCWGGLVCILIFGLSYIYMSFRKGDNQIGYEQRLGLLGVNG